MRKRLIAILAILMAFIPLGGCFHHHQTTVTQPLPPLK
jgi:hypothetical protein